MNIIKGIKKNQDPRYLDKKKKHEENISNQKTPFNKGNLSDSLSTPPPSPTSKKSYNNSVINLQKPKQFGKPIANVHLYEPPPPFKKKKKKAVPSVYGPIESNYTSNRLPFNPAYWHTGPNMPLYNPMEFKNLIKEYTINLSGLQPDTRLGQVFEERISNMTNIYQKIHDRFTFRNYVRSNLIKEDGDDIKLTGSGNTLLSHMKIVDVYPHGYNMKKKGKIIEPNTEVIDPKKFILYQACYPQKYDGRYGTVCSPISSGLNIRIYKMEKDNNDNNDNNENNNEKNEEDIKELIQEVKEGNKNALDALQGLINLQRTSNSKYVYDVFNEIKIYETFNDIVKRKLCPNFVLLYGYFISPYYTDFKNLKMMDRSDELKRNNTASTGILIALTEGPTYSFIDGCNKKYEKNGKVNRLIKQGIYDEKILASLVFQIYVILLVLKSENIFMKKIR